MAPHNFLEENMQTKIVAKIKGNRYSSISFSVNPKDLQKVLEVMDGLQEIDTEYIAGEGYHHYECGPLSLSIETNIKVYTANEMEEIRIAEKEKEALAAALKEEAETTNLEGEDI